MQKALAGVTKRWMGFPNPIQGGPTFQVGFGVDFWRGLPVLGVPVPRPWTVKESLVGVGF